VPSVARAPDYAEALTLGRPGRLRSTSWALERIVDGMGLPIDDTPASLWGRTERARRQRLFSLSR